MKKKSTEAWISQKWEEKDGIAVNSEDVSA